MIQVNERVSVEFDEETGLWHGFINYHEGEHMYVEDNLAAIVDHMVDMGEATRSEFRTFAAEFVVEELGAEL